MTTPRVKDNDRDELLKALRDAPRFFKDEFTHEEADLVTAWFERVAALERAAALSQEA